MIYNPTLIKNWSAKHIFQKRNSEKDMLVFHGSGASYIQFDPAGIRIAEISETKIQSLLHSKQRPLILLSAPYINSYVHETIILSKKELNLADSQTLSFSSSAENHRTITAIELNDKKALTVHSHLTELGIQQLDTLKKIKSSVIWKPAVLYFLQSFLLVSKQNPQWEGIFRIFLSNEMMEIHWHQSYPRLQHSFFLHQNLHPEKNIQHINEIFNHKKSQITIKSFQLINQKIDKDTFQYKVLAGLQHSESRKLKSKTQNQLKKSKSVKIIKTINRNQVLAFLLLITLIWTAWLNNQVSEAAESKKILLSSIESLKIQAKKLDELTKYQLEFHKLQALKQTIRKLQLAPHFILNELDKLLPKNLWIQEISISHGNIFFELLDNEETELSQLIELFNSKIGKTNLDKSEVTKIKHITLKKYTLSMSNIHPKLIYENLD